MLHCGLYAVHANTDTLYSESFFFFNFLIFVSADYHKLKEKEAKYLMNSDVATSESDVPGAKRKRITKQAW